MTAPLRFGIAGLGTAQADILPQMATHPHIEITAAADIRQQALDRFASEFGGETYLSVEDLCRSPNVDAIYVSTPNHLHAEHVVMAAEGGKQIVVEKPMALDLDQADAMVHAADRNQVRLLSGHTRSLDAPIRKIADIVQGGSLGAPLMINTWYYTDWLYRPRMADELNPERGGGVLYRQGPHQVDIVRTIGGGLVRTVRGVTSTVDPSRPVEGSYLGFLAFENGAAATITFNGYGYFNSHELTWDLGEEGRPEAPDRHARAHQRMKGFKAPEEEWELKNSLRYGGERSGQWGSVGHHRPDVNPAHPEPSALGARPAKAVEGHQPFFGFTVVTCEKGDIRQSSDGVYLYTAEGTQEVAVERAGNPRWHELGELYRAWSTDSPLAFNDGRWGRATLEVCLAIRDSGRQGRELRMTRQVAFGAP